MVRKVIFIENAETFRDVDPDTIAAQDLELGEIIERAQNELERIILYESLNSDVYSGKPLSTREFWQGWRIIVYALADAELVTCFSVVLLRPGENRLIDPRELFR